MKTFYIAFGCPERADDGVEKTVVKAPDKEQARTRAWRKVRRAIGAQAARSYGLTAIYEIKTTF